MSDIPPPAGPQATPNPGTGATGPATTPVTVSTPVDAGTAGAADAADIEKNRVMAILAYLGILVLVPILAAKDSRFAKYHANQGIMLLGAEVVIGFVLFIGGFVTAFIPFLHLFIGCVFWMVAGVLELAILAYVIMGIVNAVNGKCKPLPGFPEAKIIK